MVRDIARERPELEIVKEVVVELEEPKLKNLEKLEKLELKR